MFVRGENHSTRKGQGVAPEWLCYIRCMFIFRGPISFLALPQFPTLTFAVSFHCELCRVQTEQIVAQIQSRDFGLFLPLTFPTRARERCNSPNKTHFWTHAHADNTLVVALLGRGPSMKICVHGRGGYQGLSMMF